MSRQSRLAAVEAAIAAHPKGKPLDPLGQLVPDPTPMAPPIGYKRQPSMVEIIREQIRLAGLEAANQGYESFEEADDFDVGDDPELRSPYEVTEADEVPVSVLRERYNQALADLQAAEADKPASGKPADAEKPTPPPQPPAKPAGEAQSDE